MTMMEITTRSSTKVNAFWTDGRDGEAEEAGESAIPEETGSSGRKGSVKTAGMRADLFPRREAS
jgi:hypothetical protein